MHPRALLLTGLLSTIAVGATAQRDTQVPRSLSLEGAIELAIRNNPTYLQTVNDLGAQQWQVRNAFSSLFLPTLNARGTLSYTGTGSQRFLIADFSQPSATIGSSYGINLNWTFNGTSLMAPGVQAAANSATHARIDAAQMTTRNAVVQQYLATLEAQAQVELQERQVSRNEENLRLAQARFDVGQTTVIDLRQAEVAKGQSDVALLQAEQLVAVEKLRLFQTMGMPAPGDLESVALSDSFTVIEPRWALEELIDIADQSNPDVISLRAQDRSAARNEAATKSQWLPTLSFNAGWSGFTQQFTNTEFLIDRAQATAANQLRSCQDQNAINNVAGLPLDDCSQYGTIDEAAIRASNQAFPFSFQRQPFNASITISLPIFDGFNRNVQIAQASAQRDDAHEALRARELQVRTDVSQMHYGLIAAYRTIEIQENNLVAAAEQLRLAQERYRVGSGTFFELLDAQLVSQQAESDHITALYAFHRALANLEAAVGQRLR